MQKWMLAFMLPSLPVVAHDSKVAVHVVNGKNGNSVRHEHVLVFQGQSAQEVSELKTILIFKPMLMESPYYPPDTLPWLRVWVDGHRYAHLTRRADLSSLCYSGNWSGDGKQLRLYDSQSQSERTLCVCARGNVPRENVALKARF